MKIEIEYNTEGEWSGWKVTHGDKYAHGLSYDEMIGLVTAITLPEPRPTLNWLRTTEQHNRQLDYFNDLKNRKCQNSQQ